MMVEFAGVSALFTGVSVLVAVVGLWRAAALYKRQTNAQILLTCSERYDTVIAACPAAVWLGRLDAANPPPSSAAGTMAILRYLNLLCLEYYLWNQKHFSEMEWINWRAMLETNLRSPLLRREWPNLRQDFVADSAFTEYVDSVQA